MGTKILAAMVQHFGTALGDWSRTTPCVGVSFGAPSSSCRLVWLFAVAVASTAAHAETIGHARLEGMVGFTSGAMDKPGFDHVSLREVFDGALAKKCDVVMLEIESGGGIVPVGEKIVELLQERQNAGTKVVVWYGLAGSAASWIPFACPASVSKPSGMCGGSVIFSLDASGKPQAVDAKFLSFKIAKVKNAAKAVGRPELLVDAIFEQPRQVWLASDGTLLDRKPPDGREATCIDSEAGVLNMDADTSVKLGFARGIAPDRDAAARACGLVPSKWVALTPLVEGRVRRLAAKDMAMRKSVHAWFTLIDEMVSKVDQAIVATYVTASEYEADGIPDADTKLRGTRARKALNDHMAKVRDVGASLKFDEAIIPENSLESDFRTGHGVMQAAVLERVSKIRDLLAKRSTKKAAEASGEAKRLLAELREFTTSLKRPY
jgi:hypothetical protein